MSAVVALAGNPNSGKSTLFNRLTGLRQRVGNYPGVTVEKKLGTFELDGTQVTVVDLPGTYSLAARSREEAISFDVLTGQGLGREGGPPRAPDVVVIVVDASNLERNLYLALQLLDLGHPTIVALNMVDVAEALGAMVDAAALEAALGVPVVPLVAKRGDGIDALRARLGDTLARRARPAVNLPLPDAHEAALAELAALVPAAVAVDPRERRGVAAWVLGSVAAQGPSDDAAATVGVDGPLASRPELLPVAARASALLRGTHADLAAALIEARYAQIDGIVARAVRRAGPVRGHAASERIDAILLHRVFGPLALVLVMALLFESIFAWASPLMDGIEATFGALGAWVRGMLPAGALASLLVDGVIAGVGSVLVFVPQIAILFALIAVLEDCGYLARAAYVMDRVMARVGLHGRAFVPLLSGFACAVPAIMSARTIESPKDRLVTILVTPLMSCSARLPVYALVISALFDDRHAGPISTGALMLLGLYATSVVAAVVVAAVLKRSLLRSPTPPLVLELPPYKLPELGAVARRVFERCRVFVTDAGTVILACSVVLWGLLSYPKDLPPRFDVAAARAAVAEVQGEAARAEAADALVKRLEADQLAQSYAGRMGRALEPVIAPLGFDWKIGIGLVASFAAREVIVSTLGLVHGLGRDASEEDEGLREAIRTAQRDDGSPAYTPLVGLSLMVFFLFAAQCMSTLAIIRRETRSWRWPVFTFVYMTALAYFASLVVYQGGRLLGLD
jgi:ferrous iron transport protein B